MKILITNDDGVEAEGIQTLIRELEKDNEVVVVAPDIQRSAAGHSITINRPIVVKEVNLSGIKSKVYSTDGTPADCVKIGVEKIYNGKFDFIISGINHGTNLGSDVIYSGTVSAAIEGSIYKIPSIAISMDIKNEKLDFKVAAKYAREIMQHAIENKIGNDIVLNINVPGVAREEIKGIKVSQLGNRIYTNCYIETLLEDKSIGYKIEGFPTDNDTIDTDVYNLKNRYVTVTPLHYDLTNYKILSTVDSWFKQNNKIDTTPKSLKIKAKQNFKEYTDMHRVVDFLNKSLKSEGFIFGLSKVDDLNCISIYSTSKNLK